jgi:hypothetical protein
MRVSTLAMGDFAFRGVKTSAARSRASLNGRRNIFFSFFQDWGGESRTGGRHDRASTSSTIAALKKKENDIKARCSLTFYASHVDLVTSNKKPRAA